MIDNLSEGFTDFDYPLKHRRTIRTTNNLERINKEICRRTGVVGLFPNEASCLRLISALLMETSEEWQIGKRYCAEPKTKNLRALVISGIHVQKNDCIIELYLKIL